MSRYRITLDYHPELRGWLISIPPSLGIKGVNGMFELLHLPSNSARVRHYDYKQFELLIYQDELTISARALVDYLMSGSNNPQSYLLQFGGEELV